MLLIGIDPGVKTGFCVYCDKTKEIKELETLTITQAMQKVRAISEKEDVFVYYEDARLRKWFGNAGREQLQGAGSIKRDCKIWEDYLNEINVDAFAIPPKNNLTKLTAKNFASITGYTRRTSEHVRDAAMLVFGK
jgi:hypothetical protein